MQPYSRVGKAGSHFELSASASHEEREALVLYLQFLRGKGHALNVSESTKPGEVTGELFVTHFLSCKACRIGEK